MLIPSNLAEITYQIIRHFPELVQETYLWLYSDSLKTVRWVMMGLSLVSFLISLIASNDQVKGGLSGSQNFQDKKKLGDLGNDFPLNEFMNSSIGS